MEVMENIKGIKMVASNPTKKMMNIDENVSTTNVDEAQIIVDETQTNQNMAPLNINIVGTLGRHHKKKRLKFGHCPNLRDPTW